jgi:hypothetical protein
MADAWADWAPTTASRGCRISAQIAAAPTSLRQNSRGFMPARFRPMLTIVEVILTGSRFKP